MTALSSVGTNRLRDVVDVFGSLAWPAPREEMANIGARLGWTITTETPHRTRLDTAFPTNITSGRVTIDHGHIGQVTIYLTDKVAEPDANQVDEMRSLALHFRNEAAVLLGKPASVRGGSEPVHSWDLPNGGRVAISSSAHVVKLIVLQKRYADTERNEEFLGIPDNRDPDADLA
ncbi:hypothetical protein ITJ38_17985 [Agreia pratensis]|uniref:DUF6301 family protein n=1 Tax=Agreia pratensis TaxID=150121 RepID=UPI00188BC724|nr:DUF6301 family protein [Agreia pratensis]MBF4636304.1 hypothetical protein [Agreia pratensis]